MELVAGFASVAACLAVLVLLARSGGAGEARRLARIERKLTLILQHLNIEYDRGPILSDRVKELARDPATKIQAIKAYREDTGTGLAEAKAVVEDWISENA